MEKGSQSSGESSTLTTASSSYSNNSNKDHFLKSLNKLSHKISKPNVPRKPPFDHPPPPPPPPPHHHQSFKTVDNSDSNAVDQTNQPPGAPPQHQPPVYNINKNDFRDVVQKLTGSPAHDRYSTPPPIHPPKPQSSRLQRIRPPPLANVSNRPPLMNNAVPPQQTALNAPVNAPLTIHRLPVAPFSPLPPFPAVHAAAESPVSAYMRHLQNSISSSAVDYNNTQFSGFSPLAPLASPRWNNLAPQQQQQPPFAPPPFPMTSPQFQLPASPLPFGCLNSPRSPHPLLSPGLLLSPSAFPLSPTLPVPSPRWRGL